MSKVFVDALYIIALVNKHDQYHAKASELVELYDGHPLLMTDAVLVEIGNALARNFKAEAVKVIEECLSAENTEVVRLTPELFNQGFALYKSYQDKQWGLVDCISFVVMNAAGCTEALTFDQHFVQAGFHALLRD